MAKKPVNVIGLKKPKNILRDRHEEFVELCKTLSRDELSAHFGRSKQTINKYINQHGIWQRENRDVAAPPARIYFSQNRWIIRINKVKPNGEGCRGDNWGGTFATKELAEEAVREVARLGSMEYIARYKAKLSAEREARRQKNTPDGALKPRELERIKKIAAEIKAAKVEKSHIEWVNSKSFLALSHTYCYT